MRRWWYWWTRGGNGDSEAIAGKPDRRWDAADLYLADALVELEKPWRLLEVDSLDLVRNLIRNRNLAWLRDLKGCML